MAAKEKETEIRALLVEDNDIIIESLSEIMKSMGFTVVSSKLGSEAVSYTHLPLPTKRIV